MITKIFDNQKKIIYQNLENPNSWVDGGGGGVGYIPITSISLFFSFFNLNCLYFLQRVVAKLHDHSPLYVKLRKMFATTKR